jgi:Fe-S oxidoreductase
MALQDYRLMMERCSNCSYCKWIPLDKVASKRFAGCCPASSYHAFNAYSARGRFQVSTSLLDGRADFTDDMLHVINTCMTCGACDVSCKICRFNLEPLEHNIELKAYAVEGGHEHPAFKDSINNIAVHGTMLKENADFDRGSWAEDLPAKDLSSEKAEALFWAGCRYARDRELHHIPRAAVSILAAAGVDIGLLGSEERCCAGRAYSMGYRAAFEKARDQNIESIRKSGVKTIVTSCADCYHAFKRLYAKAGLDIRVLHTVEYIAELLKSGALKLTKELPLTATYHDPCHLGRQGEPYIPWEGEERKIRGQISIWDPKRPRNNGARGVYDAPRDVLRSIPGIKLVEMERIREYAWCCGAGGGCSVAYPEYAARTAGERVTEAAATGADAIVTACPWCEQSFIHAEGDGGVKLQVFDIAELVARAL